MQEATTLSPPYLARPDAPLFLVMGVPRSGTTALACALNSHPRVLCGMERFDWPLAQAIYPFGIDDFLIPRIPDAKFHQRNLDILENKTELDALGNKKPRYFFSLHALLKRTPARLILTYRNPAHSAASWNARALNPDDKGWQRGMTGLYALADFVQMLIAFRNLPDGTEALMVDYDALFMGPDTGVVLGEIFAFLDAEPDPTVLQAFAERQREVSERLRNKERSLYPFEQAFLDRRGLGELGPLMAELRLARPADLRPAIDALLDRLANTPFLDEWIGLLHEYPKSPATEFLPNYLSGLFNNAGEATLFDMLAPSLRAPEFQTFVDGVRRNAALTPANGDVARAVLAHARRQARRLPGEPLWPRVLGEQLMHMHRFEEAAQAFRRALTITPRDMNARLGLVRALEMMKTTGKNA